MLRINNVSQLNLPQEQLVKLGLTQSKQAKTPKHRNVCIYLYEDGFISEQKAENHGKLVCRYGSKKEFERAGELKLMQRAGVIKELKEQVPILIQKEYVDAAGKKQRAAYYVADFMYLRDGVTVVEDVKALDKHTGKHLTTQVFRLKWKMLQSLYPAYKFEIY